MRLAKGSRGEGKRGGKQKPPGEPGVLCGADDETRTRDPNLGKVMRYQLRYIRMRLIDMGRLHEVAIADDRASVL